MGEFFLFTSTILFVLSYHSGEYDVVVSVCLMCLSVSSNPKPLYMWFFIFRFSKLILDFRVTTDVDDVKFVINFDYPTNSEDYVHRIGRTGRQFKTGTAYTFFTPANANKAKDLINVLQEANQVVNPKLLELAQSGGFQKRKFYLFLNALGCLIF